MNTVSDFLGNAASPITGTFPDGRTFAVLRFDQSHKTRVEQHLKSVAREQLMEDRHDLSDEEFKLAYAGFNNACTSGDYKFGGPVFNRFMFSGEGGLFVAQLLLRVNDRELSRQELEKVVSVKGNEEAIVFAVRQAMGESFPKAADPGLARGTSAPAKSPASSTTLAG